jgi:glucosamine--fructose-6-phosphate aminotransferase (isomerizing)
MDAGKHTYQEILSQPKAWADALKTLDGYRPQIRSIFQDQSVDEVIFTGCGSTYYLSLSAAELFQRFTGTTTRAFPASEIWLNPTAFKRNGKGLLITVSRSGETSETIRACDKFKTENGGKCITLSCYPGMPLTEMGDLNLILPSGQEKSIAQTRAFSTLHLACTYLACVAANRDDLVSSFQKLPEIGMKLIPSCENLARKLGRDDRFDRFYFLGSASRYGLACELNLKMKEMSLSFSEAFHFLEFRHGPKSMVTENTLVIGLLSEGQSENEGAVLQEMKTRGATVLSIGETGTNIEFKSKLPEDLRNILYLPFGQMLAYERAIFKKLNPDKPNNLDAVVRLEI